MASRVTVDTALGASCTVMRPPAMDFCPVTVTDWFACSSARCVVLDVVVLEVLDVLARGAGLACCASPFCGAGVAGLEVSCACAAVQIATTARANGLRAKSRIDVLSGDKEGDPERTIRATTTLPSSRRNHVPRTAGRSQAWRRGWALTGAERALSVEAGRIVQALRDRAVTLARMQRSGAGPGRRRRPRRPRGLSGLDRFDSLL